MTDFTTLKNQAESHRKNKNYTEAIPLYKKLWEEYRENCDEWIGWGYAYCLSQQKNYEAALDICRKVYKMNSNFKLLRNLYAWCVYYTEIAVDKVKNEQQFFKAGNAIINLTEKDDKFSPFTITVLKILDYLNNKQVYQPDLVLEWSDKLKPELLDTSPFTYKDKSGKSRENPSKREQYFMYRTKALLEKGEYKECILTCENALKSINKFHYDNDVWFKWRIALSYKYLKEYSKALEILNSILLVKKEWFIQKEISEIYFLQEKMQDALKFALDSALNFGSTEMKVNLYKLLADIFRLNNDLEKAKKHIEYIYCIKTNSGNKIDVKTQKWLDEFGVTISGHVDQKIIEKELKELWNNLKFKDQKQLTGVIKNIISDGKAGFIEAEDKKQYYFKSKDFKSKISYLKKGQRVKFYLQEDFDKKKNRKTLNAVNIFSITN